MSYKVHLARNVRDEIGSWGLSRNVLIEVLCKLTTDLASDPGKHLKEQVVPYADMFTFPFTIKQSDSETILSFVFFVRRNDSQKQLDVVAAKFIDF